MSWLREALNDGTTGTGSMKRVVLLIAASAMAISLVILSLAGYIGRDVGVAMGTVAGALAGLAGHSYVGGKKVEANRAKQEKQP